MGNPVGAIKSVQNSELARWRCPIAFALSGNNTAFTQHAGQDFVAKSQNSGTFKIVAGPDMGS